MTVNGVKTDEPLNMPFGVWTRGDPKNHVLGVGPDPPGEAFFRVILGIP